MRTRKTEIVQSVNIRLNYKNFDSANNYKSHSGNGSLTINDSTYFEGEKAVLFDMDGVIVHSVPYHEPAWFEFSQKYNPNLTRDQVNKIMLGRTNKDILPEILGKELSDEEIKKYSTEKEEIFLSLIAPEIKEVKGFTGFIKSLGNMKKTIATAAPPMNIDFILAKLKINSFFDKTKIVNDSMVAKGKPNPEVYLKAAEKLGVEPKDCLVFEDSPSGIKAAKNAGMKVVGVATTIPTDKLMSELQTDFAINNFTEINMQKVNEILEGKESQSVIEQVRGYLLGFCSFLTKKLSLS